LPEAAEIASLSTGGPAVEVEARSVLPGLGEDGPGSSRLNAFTVDVEDWYQSCVDTSAAISERVVGNVHRIVELLEEARVKGTFFVQGRVAEAYPSLVGELASLGHEIQSHGYSHRSLAGMTRDELRRELDYARKTVEDACGTEVTAFRAPDFSILESNLWALELLAEAGFAVDSSIFPGRLRRYGIAGWAPGPQRLVLRSGAEILEVPVAVWNVRGLPVPVGGGGYLRLFPLAVIKRGMAAIRAEGRPVIAYCHPYEFNPRELDDYRGAVTRRRRLSQGLGRGAAVDRMKTLLQSYRFGRLDDALGSWDIKA
jgi:polysaccharide deacetylase family protein (PEP-CTERM system associated)